MKTEKNSPKIVFIGRYNGSEKLSGPEKVAKRIFIEHSQSNKTYFFQYFFDGRVSGRSKKLSGYEEERINDNAVVYTAGLFTIYKLLKQIKPDIIHIITFERFAVVALAYKFFNKVKIVYNEHGIIAYEDSELKRTSFFYRLKDKFSEKRLLKGSDKIIFVSEPAIDIAEKYYNIDENKSVILANGIDNVFSVETVNKNFNQLPKAVYIYQNELYKSGFEFLRKLMNEFNPGIELYIISDSELNLNFEASIIKPMPANELAEFYNDKHLFFALNEYDTFSIATAEAMASGLVPVVTNETGISRFIEKGYNGYLVPYGDACDFNNAVNSYINLPAEAKAKISANAAGIYNELNWKNVYDTYRNIYKQLMR